MSELRFAIREQRRYEICLSNYLMLACMELVFESSVQVRGDKLRTYIMKSSIVNDDFVLGEFAESKSVSDIRCHGHAT